MKIDWVYCVGNKLSSSTLYEILKLRNKVFIVEQKCPYQDIDDMDLSEKTMHVIGTYNGAIAAYSRVLNTNPETECVIIGRVIVAQKFRGESLGVELITKTIEQIKLLKINKPIMLSAQSHLTKFYGKFGFTEISDEYLEDNIPHIDMILKV
ncbi:TPA: GNAT family N-acetyltransferase [Proteus mirabilis]|nr:GNAT family N-acetyltransferase [Proteus mirabilis]